LVQAISRATKHRYDHVAIIIDEERCLHISFPRARLIPTYNFLQKKWNAQVLRPSFNSD
jgi:hypothetical protein